MKSKLKQFSCSSSKWVIKPQRQLATSTTHLAQELIMNVQCSGGSRGFAKEMGALKIRSIVASHYKLVMTNESHPQPLKLILLQLQEKLSKDSTSTILWSFSIWSKLEKWKSLLSRCFMSWPKIKKVVLKCCLTHQIVTCDEKWILW